MYVTHAQLLIQQLRTKNAVPPVAAALSGYYATTNSGQNSSAFVLSVSALICLMFFATLQNDTTDYALDNASKRQAPLNMGLLKAQTLGSVKVLLLLITGTCAALTQNPYNCGLLIVFAVLIWAYNRPPLHLAYRPVLSIVSLGLLLSSIPFAIGLIVSDHLLYDSAFLWLLASGLGVHRMAISCLKDYSDYAQDKLFNKRTFVIRYNGVGTKRASIVGSLCGTALAASALWVQHSSPQFYVPFTALVLLALYMLSLRLKLGTHTPEYPGNGKLFQRIFETSIYFDLLVAACLYIS